MSAEDRTYFDRDGMTITNRSIKTERHTVSTQTIHHIEERFSLGARTWYPILMVMGVVSFLAVIEREEFNLSRCLIPVFLMAAGAFNIAMGKQLIVQTDRGSVVVAKDKPWWVIREMRLALEQAMSVRNQ
ncbi:MAG: hypothetical protein U0223_12035 [Nitrospira sp.]|nr:hypothetical protein [Nitrospira sp.]